MALCAAYFLNFGTLPTIFFRRNDVPFPSSSLGSFSIATVFSILQFSRLFSFEFSLCIGFHLLTCPPPLLDSSSLLVFAMLKFRFTSSHATVPPLFVEIVFGILTYFNVLKRFHFRYISFTLNSCLSRCCFDIFR